MADAAYSSRLRTGVILCGTGTAGAYQSGVLQALLEAGIKIDVIGAHGAGVMTALAGAVDGGAKLWDPAGAWTSSRVRRAYGWRPALRFGALALLITLALLISPAIVLVVAALLYAASLLMALVNLTTASAALVDVYQRTIEMLFNPPILPTLVPRAMVLALLVIAGVLVVAAFETSRRERSRRGWRGAFLWHVIGSPLDHHEPAAAFLDVLWGLVRGASHEPRPALADIGRRYVDVLADNLGQPGFHEVVVAVHDLDSRRDLVGAVLGASGRTAFESRRMESDVREAEAVDFTGPQRELVAGFLMAAFRLPIVMAPVPILFPTDSYWRGERHRVCDRPELVSRLVDELASIGVEQVILVSPAARPAVPHAMRSRPINLRARIGEFVRSVETAALQDGHSAAVNRFSGVFVIRPDHNPIGPFDFAGAYDEASDRQRTIAELIQQGYADAYRHFIEPVAAKDTDAN